MPFMVRMIPVTPTREIFILAGQSNMSGKGILSEVPSFPYASRVKTYKNSGVWADAVEPVDDATGQVDSVSADISIGASCGLAFGSALAKLRPYSEIGLVPCAKSGTAIAQWQKASLSRSTLYGSMLARAQEARAQGTLRGVIFHQGESDASNAASAGSWAAAFLAMFNDLRADLGDPDLKAIVTKLHQDPGTAGAHWATVQAQQESLDGALGGDVVCVDASDLGGMPGDTLHLSTASLMVLGRRYASAMGGLL